MTSFVEIQPLAKSRGTGVRVGHSERNGLTVSLGGEALARMGGHERCKVLLDLDPAYPRMRIVAAKDGPFALTLPPARGKSQTRLLRVGRRPELAGSPTFTPMAAAWETMDGGKGLEIDLPRELRSTETVTKSAVAGSNSTTQSRQVTVTLAAPRVKERL